MVASQKYKNKRIAIYGMGITGRSVARNFKRLKAQIYCWDDNVSRRNEVKKLKIPLSKFWLQSKSMDYIVISPGIDIHKCKIKKYLGKNFSKIITDLDLFFEINKSSLMISITGTNGKSTTCKIIEKILKTAGHNVKTLGNIGNPVLSFRKSKKKYIFILEVSSYQLQYSKVFHSKYAAILNITPDHLERHKSINNYVRVKSKIFFAQKKLDYSYLNLKNKYSYLIKNILKKRDIKSNLTFVKESDCSFLLKKINNQYFKSKGNVENLAFAYKIAKNLKISDKIIIKAINNFRALQHRQEVIFLKNKIICINDSKATSFDASLQSLSNYKNIYWIVGGLPKFKDKYNLKNVKKNITKAYIIGKSINFFKKIIKKDTLFTISKNLKNAVDDIFSDIKNNRKKKITILLSPAAASFDQFKNFEERGNDFKNLIIKKIKKKQYV
jgi:UDP-N-acetylmuramoylalanine--D-glutamate ligase